MKHLEWITGAQGSGKTTYIERQLANPVGFGGVTRALYIGKICREKFGAGNMAKDSNAAAPEYTEAFVRELIVNAVNSMAKNDVLLIDGVPRKPSQVVWIKEQFEGQFDIKNHIQYLMCQDEIRAERAFKRDAGNEANLALNAARSQQESTVFRRVLEEAIFCNLQITVTDTTPDSAFNWPDLRENPAIEAVKFHDTNLQTMFSRHTEFANMVMSKMGVSMEELYNETSGKDVLPQMHMSVEWARKFVQKAQGELAELLRELPDNWWSKESVDLRAARVELIDAWHFLISAAMALGMDPVSFSKTFYGKLDVNIDRQRIGYSKKDKVGRDDEHVGKQETGL